MSFSESEKKPYASAIPEIPSALGALDAVGREEFWASLALCHTQGIGGRTCKRLLTVFGSAYTAVQNPKEWGAAGIRDEQITAFLSGSWRTAARLEWNATRVLCGTVLLWTDTRYPETLREIPDAPVRLYCQGDMSLLSNVCIGIVGTRACSFEGVRAAQSLAGGLAASGVTVVSGLAMGIDRQAHLASVDLPGSTIAVLGAGLDVPYPRDNNDIRERISRRGLLLSEYAPGTRADPRHFPVRNRLISGLSLGVLVVEAALRSGSLITARLALEQNRSVYAVPGALGSRFAVGCQELVRQGAQAVFSSADILRDLSAQLRGSLRQGVSQSAVPGVAAPNQAAPNQPVRPNPAPVQRFSPAPQAPVAPDTHGLDPASPEYRILTLLGKGAALSADDLCQQLALPPETVGSTVVILEVRGRVQRLANLQYRLA
ncbi:MAG: DNA-processing protein DprA [Bilophila sp.]